MFWSFLILVAICTALIRMGALTVWVAVFAVIESNTGAGRWNRSVDALATAPKLTSLSGVSYKKTQLNR